MAPYTIRREPVNESNEYFSQFMNMELFEDVAAEEVIEETVSNTFPLKSLPEIDEFFPDSPQSLADTESQYMELEDRMPSLVIDTESTILAENYSTSATAVFQDKVLSEIIPYSVIKTTRNTFKVPEKINISSDTKSPSYIPAKYKRLHPRMRVRGPELEEAVSFLTSFLKKDREDDEVDYEGMKIDTDFLPEADEKKTSPDEVVYHIFDDDEQVFEVEIETEPQQDAQRISKIKSQKLICLYPERYGGSRDAMAIEAKLVKRRLRKEKKRRRRNRDLRVAGKRSYSETKSFIQKIKMDMNLFKRQQQRETYDSNKNARYLMWVSPSEIFPNSVWSEK